MKFLNSATSRDAIKTLLADAGSVRIAVAYWGKGACDFLELKGRKGVTIVCNLMSGGCNPWEVRELKRIYGSEHILTHDNLHAKVWLTDTGAIVGSSNASANGLGQEGESETAGLVEANVLLEKGPALETIRAWFDDEVMPSARKIRKVDFLKAEELWKRRRADRPIYESTSLNASASLIERLKQNPSAFEDRELFVWIYKHENRSAAEKSAMNREQKDRKNKKIDSWSLYSGDKLPKPGSFIIDFNVETGKPKLIGPFWQVLKDNPVVKVGKWSLVLCLPREQFKRLRLGNKKEWEKAAAEAWASDKSRDTWDIHTFATQFLR